MFVWTTKGFNVLIIGVLQSIQPDFSQTLIIMIKICRRRCECCHKWTGSGQVKGACGVWLGQGVKKQVWVHTEGAELGSASSTHQEGNQWYCINQPQSHSLEYNRKLEACTKWGGKQATIYSVTPQMHSFMAKQNFKKEKSKRRDHSQRLGLLSSTVTEMGCFCWMVCVWGKRA